MYMFNPHSLSSVTINNAFECFYKEPVEPKAFVQTINPLNASGR